MIVMRQKDPNILIGQQLQTVKFDMFNLLYFRAKLLSFGKG